MNFYLFSEGPLYKFYQWLGLAKKPFRLFQRRIYVICLFTWLPLPILTLISHVKFSWFMSDFDVHVRFLLSLALLLYAEVIANERFQIVVRQFIKCNIIAEKDRQQYNTMITSAVKLSSSTWIEVLLLLFVITIGRWISNQVLPFDFSAWYATKVNNSVTLTLPGYWYDFVSLPIFQFILLRWYYRVLIWYRFLWQVSKLKLQLNSLHPDKAGGIGFLVNSVYGLEPFLIAHSVLLAGIIFSSIINTHTTLWQFQYEILSWVLVLICIPLIPMTFFILQLLRAKRNGTNEYDVVANQYVTEFRKKWINSESQHKDQFLGSSDIQSLADLSNSFNVSAQMHVLPFGKNAILFLFVFTALPFFPLIFTAIPFNKILMQMLGIVF